MRDRAQVTREWVSRSRKSRLAIVAAIGILIAAVGSVHRVESHLNSEQVSPPTKNVITMNPLTTELELGTEIRSQIASNLKRPDFDVRLTLKGVKVCRDFSKLKGVRVFCNAPKVSQATPVEDKHYVGSFAFLKIASKDGPDEIGDFFLSLTATLRRLSEAGDLRLDRPISFTLVAVPEARTTEEVVFVEFRELLVTTNSAKN